MCYCTVYSICVQVRVYPFKLVQRRHVQQSSLILFDSCCVCCSSMGTLAWRTPSSGSGPSSTSWPTSPLTAAPSTGIQLQLSCSNSPRNKFVYVYFSPLQDKVLYTALHPQQAFHMGHGPNIYKDTKHQRRLFLKLTSKGTWRQVFIILRPPIPSSPRYTLHEFCTYTCTYSHKRGRKYQHD